MNVDEIVNRSKTCTYAISHYYTTNIQHNNDDEDDDEEQKLINFLFHWFPGPPPPMSLGRAALQSDLFNKMDAYLVKLLDCLSCLFALKNSLQ
ncbi:hypothetical protein HPULCUR_012082 [Helicostylum pulchrum]|uniref:Uncharacterized protein n=1 Tax=Helicostylum pulchrum TaxID=562976 RepID=A0ABP9YI56_9FUNG